MLISKMNFSTMETLYTLVELDKNNEATRKGEEVIDEQNCY